MTSPTARPTLFARAQLAFPIAGALFILMIVAELIARPEVRILPTESLFLWWPRYGAFEGLVSRGGFLAAALMAVWVAWRGRRSPWDWAVAGGLAVLVLGFSAWPATHSFAALERDRIVVRSGWPAAQVQVYPLAEVRRIEVFCFTHRQSRSSLQTAIGYALVLSDGARVSPSERLPRGPFRMNRWVETLSAWDESPALQAASRSTSVAPECMSDLEKALSPRAFAAAKRLAAG